MVKSLEGTIIIYSCGNSQELCIHTRAVQLRASLGTCGNMLWTTDTAEIAKDQLLRLGGNLDSLCRTHLECCQTVHLFGSCSWLCLSGFLIVFFLEVLVGCVGFACSLYFD
uniref:Uncharacterized protein n=2 Tax=Opuntia streptacantha TaxID=393608 RepID=A0A7C9CCD9_OPUST